MNNRFRLLLSTYAISLMIVFPLCVFASAGMLYNFPAELTFIKSPQITLGYEYGVQHNKYTGIATLSGGTVVGSNSVSNTHTSFPAFSFEAPCPDRKFFYGIGLLRPLGLSSDVSYQDDAVSRYSFLRAEFHSYVVVPALAVKVTPAFSIGTGLDLYFNSIIFDAALPRDFPPTASVDYLTYNTASGTSLGAHINLLYMFRKTGTMIEATYDSGATAHLTGRSTRTNAAGTTTGKTDGFNLNVPQPPRYLVKVAQFLTPTGSLLAGVVYRHTQWGKVQQIDFKNIYIHPTAIPASNYITNFFWQNTDEYAAYLHYQITKKWVLQPLLAYANYPEEKAGFAPRAAITTSYKVNKHFSIIAHYLHFFAQTYAPTPTGSATVLTGTTKVSNDYYEVTLKYDFI